MRQICLGVNDCVGNQNLGESLATMTFITFVVRTCTAKYRTIEYFFLPSLFPYSELFPSFCLQILYATNFLHLRSFLKILFLSFKYIWLLSYMAVASSPGSKVFFHGKKLQSFKIYITS